MAAPLILTDQSVGAPALTGQYGSLCTVLDWALVQRSWAIEYTAANIRVYRPGAGNRFRLYVNHSSSNNMPADARYPEVRAAEGASAASFAGLINPFPNILQRTPSSALNQTPLCTWTVSQAASAVARPYYIALTDRWVRIWINANATTAQGLSFASSGWEVTYFFGDVEKAYSEDAYNTCITVDYSVTSSSSNSGNLLYFGSPSFNSGYGTFWARDITGTILSTYGCLNRDGNTSGAPSVRAGYQNKIVHTKLGLHCTGLGFNLTSQNTTTSGPTGIMNRGWLPNHWALVHTGGGSESSNDTFLNSAYNASASFRIFKNTYSTAPNHKYLVIEETDTWSVPSTY